jgi:hypothetical protein
VPISFTIEPSHGLLRTVVIGRLTNAEIGVYIDELRAHPAFGAVTRRLIDVRHSTAPSADELVDLLGAEQRALAAIRRTDRRAILTAPGNGPALGRELVVGSRTVHGTPVAYRVFRDLDVALRHLRLDSWDGSAIATLT